MGTSHRLNRWIRQVGADSLLHHFASLAAQSHDGRAAVFAVDGNHDVVFWSPEAEHLLGFTASEMIGQHCLKANRCAECIRHCQLNSDGPERDTRVELHTRDGHKLTLLRSGRAFYDPSGAFLGGIEVLRRPSTDGRDASVTPISRSANDDSSVAQFHGLTSRDPAMIQAFEIIRNVAETDATVLVRGESGTGKELVARAIHAESHRADGPFLAVNCAALSPTLLESELFGHVKGAFTGAYRDRQGLFQRADKGTLLLDEVAELPLDLQAKLLRVLQERCVSPVGSSSSIDVDVRIVAATHRALRQKTKRGEFREDLLYRLRVVPIYLPALRERRGDVEILLWEFIQSQNQRGPRHVGSISPAAMRALLDHTWPGNIRELQNIVQYAFAVGRGPELLLSELPPEFREPRPVPRTTTPRDTNESTIILAALEAHNGHVGRAAASLGMSRPTFWRRRKKWGI